VPGDGYKAAVINYGFLANAVLTTDDTVKAMKSIDAPAAAGPVRRPAGAPNDTRPVWPGRLGGHSSTRID
jgi:hypothetical protein